MGIGKDSICIGLVGATGAVGREVLRVLEKRRFPIRSLKCYASLKSADQKVRFENLDFKIHTLEENCFKGLDIVIFCAGKNISEKYVPKAVEQGAIAIDNSSFFRMRKDVPLVVPEINPHALRKHKGIVANPNCTTAIMLMPLAPLHKEFGIKRIVASTYQAASGAGSLAMQELQEETAAVLNNIAYKGTVFPFPYAFNLFPHNSPMTENGYVEEELKLLYETRKILEDDSIQVTATCIRVPILRAHSGSLNVQFKQPISKDTALNRLQNISGVRLFQEHSQNRFPMPIDASGEDDVFCGRIREDLFLPNTLEFWIVGDQLLKGAALNAVQIAELLINA